MSINHRLLVTCARCDQIHDELRLVQAVTNEPVFRTFCPVYRLDFFITPESSEELLDYLKEETPLVNAVLLPGLDEDGRQHPNTFFAVRKVDGPETSRAHLNPRNPI